jgi:hypothetical protein
MYKVFVTKKVMKTIHKMPLPIQKKMANLLEDLEKKGPIQNQWLNFSRLNEGRYHCHLSHKWIACWYNERNDIEIEVYYAGSRENAPY